MNEMLVQAEPTVVERNHRDKIWKAFCIEFDVMLDQPAMQSKELRGWMLRDFWDGFAKTGGVASAVRWGATQHPMTFAITAIVGAAIAAKNLGQYKNYCSNQNDFGMALAILLNANHEDMKSLSLPVAGGLLRFVKEMFVDRFANRYSALKELPASDQEEARIANRIRIYEDGLRESSELENQLLVLVNALEERKKAKLHQLKEAEEKKQLQTSQTQSSLEARYKAGLLSHQEYADQVGKLRSEKLESFAKKVEILGREKFVQIDDDKRDLESFCRKLFPDFFAVKESPEEGKGKTLLILSGIFIVFIIFLMARH